jgi:phosphopantetheinyl transferase
MEDLPQIGGKRRIPLKLPVADYLRDHLFNGRAVFPAVEAMGVLAASARDAVQGLDVSIIAGADFNKFLYVDPGMTVIEAFNEIGTNNGGDTTSKLVTVRKQGTTSITRAVGHVALRFPGTRSFPAAPPLDETLGLEGICLHPDKELIYRDLVPFLSAYRNIEKLHVSHQGALALVSGGTAEAPREPLGSPFPLDAAFHAACVWGQRHAGIVGFPVHIDERVILNKTAPGGTYIARVTPRSADGGLLLFDLWIYDCSGSLCEAVRGLHMRDVSGGTLRPPQWIRDNKEQLLENIRSRCADMAIIELDTITPPCEGIFSEAERERSASMREKRRLTFCSARLALKRLSRRMPGSDMTAPPETITTINPDGRPRCPRTDGTETLHCTASHDPRFAIAAVSEFPIGIDVEEITPRVLKGQSHYMNDEEIALVKNHPLGEMEASIRVWSAKEALSKATGLHLVETWRKSAVKEIGMDSSMITIDGKKYKALHGIVEGHMVTIIVMD